MSKPFDEQTFRMEIPPKYVCTGEEVDGIQEAIVDGNSYFFYLANAIAGAIILCINGHFYTNDSRMTINLPSYTEENTIPAEETTETQTIEGRGQGGTEQGGEYYGTIPEEDQGDNVETLTTYEADGTPQTRTTSEILPSATSKLNMQGGNDNKDCDWVFIQLDGVTAGLKFNNVSPLSTFYYSTVTRTGVTPQTNVVCTHFKNKNAVENYVCYGANNAITFHHSFATLAEANAWLAEVKPIVAYSVTTSVKSTVQTTPFDIPRRRLMSSLRRRSMVKRWMFRQCA